MRRDRGDSLQNKPFPQLRGRVNADVAIVGGGLTGITAAALLGGVGMRVALVEAKQLGSGATLRCAGAVIPLKRFLFSRLENSRGPAAAKAFWSTQLSALRSVRTMTVESDVQWEECSLQLFSGNEEQLVKEYEAMLRAGLNVERIPSSHVGKQAILCKGMGMVDARAYFHRLCMKAEQAHVSFFEQSQVISVDDDTVYTDQGSIRAPYVIIATGYPIINVPGWYFLRLEQRRSIRVRLAGNAGNAGIYAHADGNSMLLRSHHGMVLQLNGHTAGVKENLKGEAVRLAASLQLPVADSALEGWEVYSADGLPYIGPYCPHTPNMFVAAGYNGCGLVGSMLAAQGVSARILGLPAQGYEIYEREGRSFALQALRTGGRFAASYLRPSAPVCPHLGCKLLYRADRRIWECPCHGSRFDDIGRIIAGPALRDAKIDHRNRR